MNFMRDIAVAFIAAVLAAVAIRLHGVYNSNAPIKFAAFWGHKLLEYLIPAEMFPRWALRCQTLIALKLYRQGYSKVKLSRQIPSWQRRGLYAVFLLQCA